MARKQSVSWFWRGVKLITVAAFLQTSWFLWHIAGHEWGPPATRPEPGKARNSSAVSVAQKQSVFKVPASTSQSTITLPPSAIEVDLAKYARNGAGAVSIEAAPNSEESPGENGRGFPKENFTAAQQEEFDAGWKRNRFNEYASNRISLRRSLPDVRTKTCQAKSYPTNLPDTSVIICFYNEARTTLLRSVHSVLDRSPKHLIKEIILVDDNSTMPHLGKPLEEYLAALGKVRLMRSTQRVGLVRARLIGAAVATGTVLTFLDSHIECTRGWLEPLLARIAQDRTHVVSPVIDNINKENLEYTWTPGDAPQVGGFDWGMTFTWHPAPEADLKREGVGGPVRTPTIAGGLFSMERLYFEELGTYDTGQDIWGGENLEMSFRIWMCGGTLEMIPCSHVGHIFRSESPYMSGAGGIIKKNLVRVAEVWMDDYKRLVQLATSPLPKSLPLGDVSARVDLRRRLQCKSFDWYIKNVVPDLYVPKLGPNAVSGSLRNEAFGACIDTLGSKNSGEAMGVYPCHGQHGSQALVLDGDGLMLIPAAGYKNCMAAQSGKIVVQSCDKSMQRNVWEYDRQKLLFISKLDNSCLQASRDANDKSPYTLAVTRCTGEPSQRWTWMD
mmetsp:Transcript_45970/g.99856  ORF Transcript_45970/g.99856 Transcript_45970/m.99856 type:complete len:613 (+) Transcript_45970:116-1954(+)